MDVRAEIERLEDEALSLPESSLVAVELLESAIRLADSVNDIELGYQLREHLLGRSIEHAAWDRFLIHFAWILARHDEDPDQFFGAEVLWYYKWALNTINDDPSVPLSRIEGLLEDFERRLSANGYSLRPLYQHRLYYDRSRFSLDAIESHYQRWVDAPRDGLADCDLCENDALAETLNELGRVDEALEAWRSIVASPLRCAAVPATTWADMLRPLLATGRLDEADRCHEAGYPELRNTRFLFAIGTHLAYEASRYGPTDKSLDILQHHLQDAVTNPLPNVRYGFYRAAVVSLRRFQAAKYKALPLRLPEGVPVETRDGQVTVDAAERWFDDECRRICGLYDQRNGNNGKLEDYQSFLRDFEPR